MAILLGLVYAVIAPIITPIALVYFLVCSLLYKYNAIYVFSPRFQSGGQVSPLSLHLYQAAENYICSI